MKKKKSYGVQMDSRDDKMPSMPGKRSIESAGKEMKSNPPAILAHTAKKFGKKRAKKQKIAIMLAKARRGE